MATIVTLENFTSCVPKSRSDIKKTATASTKNGKYTMPTKPKMTDTQKGIKSTENNSIKEAKTRSAMLVYYLEASSDASPM